MGYDQGKYIGIIGAFVYCNFYQLLERLNTPSDTDNIMDITIVSGFLGAGKTTFILEFIKRYSGDGGKRVAVLVNEFGSLSIDGEVIRKGDLEVLEVVELPSGCICCSLRASLPEAIDMIYESVKPDVLLIEPSGIATPANVLSAIKRCKHADKYIIRPVIGIVDATVFQEFVDDFGEFYREQIENAEVLLINKTDLVSDEELDEIEKRVREINPQALVVRTRYCRFTPEGGEHSGMECENHGEHESVHESSYELPLESISIVPKRRFSEEELEEVLKRLVNGEFGEVIRAKGFVECDGSGGGLCMFQVAGREYEIVEWRSDDSSRDLHETGSPDPSPEASPKAVFMGSGLKAEELKRVFGGREE